jgi:hypothetical protein
MASLMAQMGQGGGAGAPGGGEGGEGGASNIDFEALMKQASRSRFNPLWDADIAQLTDGPEPGRWRARLRWR